MGKRFDRHSQSHSATIKYHNFFDNSIITIGVGGFEHSMPPLETPRDVNQLSCKALGKIKYYNSPYQSKIGQTITFVCKIKAQDI